MTQRAAYRTAISAAQFLVSFKLKIRSTCHNIIGPRVHKEICIAYKVHFYVAAPLVAAASSLAVSLGHSRSNNVYISRGITKSWERWLQPAWNRVVPDPRITPPPMLPCQIWSLGKQTACTEIRWTFQVNIKTVATGTDP